MNYNYRETNLRIKQNENKLMFEGVEHDIRVEDTWKRM